MCDTRTVKSIILETIEKDTEKRGGERKSVINEIEPIVGIGPKDSTPKIEVGGNEVSTVLSSPE